MPQTAAQGRFCRTLPACGHVAGQGTYILLKRITLAFALCGAFLFGCPRLSATDQPATVVVFYESGFLAEGVTAPSQQQLEVLLPGALLATADQLATSLNHAECRMLVLPYGSAFPEGAWPAILARCNGR